MLLLGVMSGVYLLAEPQFMSLAHFLKPVCQGFADFLDLALLFLGKDQVSFTCDGSLQDLLADELADKFADSPFLELEFGSKAVDGDGLEAFSVANEVALQGF